MISDHSICLTMPQNDKPLHELRTYLGINPRPADHDAYWAAALAELDATPPDVELRPVTTPPSANADLFDLYFTGVGGARIHAKYLRPRGQRPPGPALLQFHGYGADVGDWYDKLGYVGEGFVVAAMNCRGQGDARSEDNLVTRGNTREGHILRGLNGPPDQLLFRQIFLDTAQLARIVLARPEVDPARVGSSGGSQGGALALVSAALEPRLRRVVSLYPFLSDFQRVWNMDLAQGAYGDLQAFFRRFDPLHEREEEIFTRLGYIDIRHLVPRIRAEVLMGITLRDTTCPPSSQFAAYNHIATKKEVLVYPDFSHEAPPGFHDRAFAFLMGLREA